MGIVLVFLGHLLSGGSLVAIELKKIIYSFHMPMYFILSGYVYEKDFNSFRGYCGVKFKRILLPALILYLLSLPIYFIGIDYSNVSIWSIVEPVIYLNGRCAYNAPVWFFICIFQVLIVAKLLNIEVDDRKKVLLVLIATLVVSYLFYIIDWKCFKLFGLDKCVFGLFFFYFGVLLKRTSYGEKMILVAFASLPIWITSGIIMQPQVFMYGMELSNFWLYIVSAITGSFAFYALCSFVAKNETIREYSKWTIFIICSHYVLVTLFKIISSRVNIGGTYIYDIASICFVSVVLLVYRPVCRFLESRIPFLMGK